MITIDPIKRPPKKSSSVDTTEIMKEVDQKISQIESQMITGDVTYIRKVTALPDNPDPNTLYIITS